MKSEVAEGTVAEKLPDTLLWSAKQAEALEAVSTWLKKPSKQVFRVFGYAGTGKTTLARHFAAELGMDAVRFATYTGKAASVLRERGCLTATTIHRMVYNPDGEVWDEKKKEYVPTFSLKDEWLSGVKLIVLDECSMLDKEVAKDLLALNRPVLVLGDPFQLPPIGNTGGYFTHSAEYPENTPDILLTEIHRQAAGSPIIQLATKIRNGEYIADGDYGDVIVTSEPMLDKLPTLGYEQIICGTNPMRCDLNSRVRAHFGYTMPRPQPGERLVCLRNDTTGGVLNGEVYTVISSRDYNREKEVYQVDVVDPTGRKMSVTAWDEALRGESLRAVPYYKRRWHMEFAYGYALTCHKAQGSQYQSVAVVDQASKFKPHEARWLYTAATRAQQKLLIVR